MDYKTLFADLTVAHEVLFAGDEEKAFIQYLNWLEDSIKQNVTEVNELKSENEALKIKLKHARSSFDFQMKRRLEAEDLIKQYERQYSLLRDVLCSEKHLTLLNEEQRSRLAFLHSGKGVECGTSPDSSVLLSQSDISIDPVDGDHDISHLRNGKKWKRRRTASIEGTIDEEDEIVVTVSPKRLKQSEGHDFEVTAKAKVIVPQEAKKAKSGSPAKPRTKEKSKTPEVAVKSPSSSPLTPRNVKMTINDQENLPPTTIRQLSASPQKRSPNLYPVLSELQQKLSAIQQPSSPPTVTKTPSMRSPQPPTVTNQKGHSFVTKTVIKPETCQSCNKKIKFGKQVMKCRDCRASMHPECSEKTQMSCVPMATTPKKHKCDGELAVYCPNAIPRVPSLVSYCVQEIERRGLHEVGIYRIPGSDKHIKELKEKLLKSKGNPHLENMDDINTICGALKDFFRNLREPLLTFRLHGAFTAAADHVNEEEGLAAILEAIAQLPPPNKDTLAYMILHLQKVAAFSDANKMPIVSLAKVFGPTLVGHSTPSPDPSTIWKETNQQPKVLEKMLNIAPAYWQQYMSSSDNPDGLSPAGGASPVNGSPMSSPPRSPATPEYKPVPESPFLGPCYSPKGTRGNYHGRTPYQAPSKSPTTKGKTPKKTGNFFGKLNY